MEIAPGIFLLDLPLPFTLKQVNIYLVKGTNGYALIDCGLNTDEGFAALRSCLKALGVGLEEIKLILVTHFHPDHYGLMNRIIEFSNAEVAMHELELQRAKEVQSNQEQMNQEMFDLFLRHGMPREDMAGTMERMKGMPRLKSISVDHVLEGGEKFAVGPYSFEAVWTPGHANGHVCFYDSSAGLLLSGDHLLPEITPHIGYYSRSQINPLQDYLNSLHLLESLNLRLALPGHGPIIDHPQERVHEILRHHDERALAMAGALEGGPKTVYEVARVIFGTGLSSFDRWFAFTETLAHMVWLSFEDMVEKISSDSMVHFGLTAQGTRYVSGAHHN